MRETCAVQICANTHIPTEYMLICVLFIMGAHTTCALIHILNVSYTKCILNVSHNA